MGDGRVEVKTIGRMRKEADQLEKRVASLRAAADAAWVMSAHVPEKLRQRVSVVLRRDKDGSLSIVTDDGDLEHSEP